MKSCPQCGKAYEESLEFCPDDRASLIQIESDASDPMLGKLLAGRFLLTEKLGQGGMGAVYKAIHTMMDRACAIKLLTSVAADSESMLARFNREAKMASRIDNPHAVTIYDFGEAEGGVLYLAMEYIAGKPLSRVIAQERRLGIDRAVNITNQIAEALSAAHALGIVHRDLKPDNIMITRKGGENDYVKVLDFGIAKTVADEGGDNLTKTGFILGTPVYMSPEQLSGERLDARSDVYSLAIIAYEMLSGRLPFEGDNLQAIMIKRLMSDPIPLALALPSINDLVNRAVMAGLARNRDARSASAQEFASGLSAAARAGTQVLSGRSTSMMSSEGAQGETSDRAGSPTGPGGIDTQGKTISIGSEALEENDARASSLHQSIDSAVTRPEPLSPPPSAFVTQPATSTDSASKEQTEQAGHQSSVAPPTRVGMDRVAPPTRIGMEQQRAEQSLRYGPPDYPSAAQATMPVDEYSAAALPQQKSKAPIIAAALVVCVLALAVAGYFAYSRLFASSGAGSAPSQSSSASSPSQQANTAGNSTDAAVATQHYENAKKHQEQAYMLANAGSKAEARAENEKAISELQQALAIKPRWPEARENLGVALYNMGNLEASLEEYRKAIEQYERPTAQVFTNYGLTLFALKQYSEAATAFGRALDLDPTDYDLYAHRGFALQNAGDEAGAKAAYRQYLSVAPSGQYANDIREILAGRARPTVKSGE